MTTAYSAAIKITFDKEILSNPESVLGSEPVRFKSSAANTPFSSGDYSSTYSAAKAFDGSTSTYWRSASTTMPQYIGTDFGTAKTFTKARVYLDSYKPGAYQLQGSNDNSVWTDVATGTFTSTTGWQSINFSPATFRYWRLYLTSRQSTYCYVYEIEFYEARTTYDVSGWTVTGYEYDRIPGGTLQPVTYDIYRITKTVDNLAVILWLDLGGRMLNPIGQVTVTFNGYLLGPGGATVEAFSQAFTPTNIDKMFNPNNLEKVEVASIVPTATRIRIYYSTGYASEKVEVSGITPTATLTHINDL